MILLFASYIFYAHFSFVFTFLMLFSTVFTYSCSIYLSHFDGKKRKICEVIGISFNVLLLSLCKFQGSLVSVVGVSYYSFKAISYIIDCYKSNYVVERNFIKFGLYISFFPAIIAGPIDRSTNFISQLDWNTKYDSDKFKDGILFLLVGLFKKMVISDNLAVIVTSAFGNINEMYGIAMLFAVFCYSMQIYCDFSACADLAIGSAKLFGLDLILNFNSPYLASSIKDFWRRWHISLTSWFKDYVYIPLGGNRKSKVRTYINILIVFILSGIWHGVSLNFVVWGLIHALYQIIESILNPARKKIDKLTDSCKPIITFVRMAWVYVLVTFAWIFFRAESIHDACDIIKLIFSKFDFSQLSQIVHLGQTKCMILVLVCFSVLMIVLEGINRKHNLANIINKRILIRYLIYFIIIMLIAVFGYYGPEFNPIDFVYFRF